MKMACFITTGKAMRYAASPNTDAKFDPSVLGDISVANAHLALDFRCTFDRVDHAREFDQHAVANKLDDATFVFGDLAIDQFVAMRLQCCQRANFVSGH